MSRGQGLCLGLLLLALAAGLPPATAQAQVRALVSLPPQRYFVEKVGGELASVTVMVPAGADAHTYEPRPSQMKALAQARVYFAVGVEFEKAWLDKFQAANRELLIVHTEAQVPRVALENHGDQDHDQGREGKAAPAGGEEHDHQGLDPHIWLSPLLVATQAAAVRDGLVQVDPAHRAVYDRNLANFTEELKRLDGELREAFRGLGEARRILVFHPAWGYLCRAYGLEQVAIEAEGREPTARGLKHLLEQAREHRARVIFVQPQFSARSAEAVARAINGRVVPLDPLAEDWAANLKKVVRELREALF